MRTTRWMITAYRLNKLWIDTLTDSKLDPISRVQLLTILYVHVHQDYGIPIDGSILSNVYRSIH